VRTDKINEPKEIQVTEFTFHKRIVEDAALLGHSSTKLRAKSNSNISMNLPSALARRLSPQRKRSCFIVLNPRFLMSSSAVHWGGVEQGPA
jgi:hypothetical protein